MRVHIANPAGDDPFAITQAQWDAAMARHGAGGVSVTFGAAPADTEILIAPPGVLARMLPLDLPRLKMIFLTASGPDRLMPFTWLPAGVALVNNRGVHGRKVGEYVAMALLMLANRMPEYAAQQRAQEWLPHFSPVLRGRRLTVVGTGDLGSGAARQARHFGMVVTGVNRSGRPQPDFDIVVTGIDAVLPASEFVVLACPLTEQTRNLLDARRIGLLPSGAGLVNVGRGALLDMGALCDRLDAGTLSGAVCDVFDPEPIAPGDRIWTTRNLVVTPHVAADDPVSYNSDSLDLFFVNLAAWRAGAALPNVVDLTRGY
jgi:phosphoglycerate dehydrogenase-like enzyme